MESRLRNVLFLSKTPGRPLLNIFTLSKGIRSPSFRLYVTCKVNGYYNIALPTHKINMLCLFKGWRNASFSFFIGKVYCILTIVAKTTSIIRYTDSNRDNNN